jgi:hypothetical protein
MWLGIVGDSIFSHIELKHYSTPTSVKCHRNIRDTRTAIELIVAGVRGWGSWWWRQLENSQSS